MRRPTQPCYGNAERYSTAQSRCRTVQSSTSASRDTALLCVTQTPRNDADTARNRPHDTKPLRRRALPCQAVALLYLTLAAHHIATAAPAPSIALQIQSGLLPLRSSALLACALLHSALAPHCSTSPSPIVSTLVALPYCTLPLQRATKPYFALAMHDTALPLPFPAGHCRCTTIPRPRDPKPLPADTQRHFASAN